MPKNQTQPIKLLVYTYSPAIVSSYSTITKNLLSYLAKTKQYEIDVIAVNDHGYDKNKKEFPYCLHTPAKSTDQDTLQRNYFLDIVHGTVPDLTPPWDIILIFFPPELLKHPTHRHPDGVLSSLRSLQRDNYMKKSSEHWFKVVGLYPQEYASTSSDINSVIGITDVIIAPSQSSKNYIAQSSPGLVHSVNVIYPSVNTKIFKPLSREKRLNFRDSYFKGNVDSSTFLITTVAKNYYLNDLTRTLQIFAQFHHKHPNSFLYLHTDVSGPFVNLIPQAEKLGLELHQDWSYPEGLGDHRHFPQTTLNAIYNASDVVLSTTQGSWWGLHLTEAMSTKTLCLAPALPAILEQFNTKNDQLPINKSPIIKSTLRGIPLKTTNSTTYGVADYNHIRPLTDIDDAVKKLDCIYQHPTRFAPIKHCAYQWSKTLNSKTIGATWHDALMNTYKHILKERKSPHDTLSRLSKN